jgi:hypothetical protein
MIFGHAPVIFPAILRLNIRFTERFWIHLVLLHAGLALRIAGDVAGVYELRAWGALLNLFAILLFLAQTVTSLERR